MKRAWQLSGTDCPNDPEQLVWLAQEACMRAFGIDGLKAVIGQVLREADTT